MSLFSGSSSPNLPVQRTHWKRNRSEWAWVNRKAANFLLNYLLFCFCFWLVFGWSRRLPLSLCKWKGDKKRFQRVTNFPGLNGGKQHHLRVALFHFVSSAICPTRSDLFRLNYLHTHCRALTRGTQRVSEMNECGEENVMRFNWTMIDGRQGMMERV